jgi:glycine/D-amino acid oxidase-like deaminating enzyme
MLKQSLNSSKVIIIGSGFSGLTSAISLRLQGYDVVIISSKQKNKASKAAQGLNAVKGIFHASDALFEQKLEAHRYFFEWIKLVESLSGECVSKIIGVWEKFDSLHAFQNEEGRIYRRDFTGLKQKKSTNLAEYPSPFLFNHYPNDFWIDVDSYFSCLNKAATSIGVTFVEGDVTGIQEEGYSYNVEVFCHDSKHTSNIAVVCSGAGIAQIKGLEEISDHLIASEGVSFEATIDYKLNDHTPWQNNDGASFVKALNTLTFYQDKIYAGTVSKGPQLPLSILTPEQTFTLESDEWRKHFLDILTNTSPISLPSSALRSLMPKWGVRVRQKNRRPLVAKVNNFKNVFVNTGYYKNGLVLAPYMASELVKILRSPASTT